MNHLLGPLSVRIRAKTDGASENDAQSTNDRYRCGADEYEKKIWEKATRPQMAKAITHKLHAGTKNRKHIWPRPKTLGRWSAWSLISDSAVLLCKGRTSGQMSQKWKLKGVELHPSTIFFRGIPSKKTILGWEWMKLSERGFNGYT